MIINHETDRYNLLVRLLPYLLTLAQKRDQNPFNYLIRISIKPLDAVQVK